MKNIDFNLQLFANGDLAVTMADFRKRTSPDGGLDFIIEALEKSNPILDDMIWMEGNLVTGNQTTLRTSLPRPSIRKINRGVKNTKSTTAQIMDTCCSFEDRSMIDVKLLKLQKDKEAFRRSEDSAHVQGFSEVLAELLFYGDTQTEPDEFNGLSVRYSALGGEKGTAGYQVVSAGTPGTKTNTSAFFVGWSEHTTTGIYPRNSKLGLNMQDLGELDELDENGNKYRAVTTLFGWDMGLAVRDIRANAAVRNIDKTKLENLTPAASLALVKRFINAKNRIRGLDNGNRKNSLYVSDSMYNFFECYLLDKNNVHVTRQELQNKPPQLYLAGIPIKKCEAILENEEAIAE